MLAFTILVIFAYLIDYDLISLESIKSLLDVIENTVMKFVLTLLQRKHVPFEAGTRTDPFIWLRRKIRP